MVHSDIFVLLDSDSSDDIIVFWKLLIFCSNTKKIYT